MQQAARQGRVEYSKVPGQLNPADMFTKAVDERTMLEHAARVGQQGLGGRSEMAPKRRGARATESPQEGAGPASSSSKAGKKPKKV